MAAPLLCRVALAPGCSGLLLLVAAGFAALVAIPLLRTKNLREESKENFIYFGHARFWEARDLEAAIKNEEILPQLSRQIVIMAEIAWTKHIRVQWSFSLAAAGGIVLTATGLGSATL